MKISDLRRIIQEELAAALAENAPAKEKEEKETKEKEKTPSKPGKRRQIGNPTIPKTSPIPIKNQNLSEAEKELAKIVQRYLKLKK